MNVDVTSNIEGVHTFKLAMNEFGDLLGSEFVSTMNGARPRAEKKVSETGDPSSPRSPWKRALGVSVTFESLTFSGPVRYNPPLDSR